MGRVYSVTVGPSVTVCPSVTVGQSVIVRQSVFLRQVLLWDGFIVLLSSWEEAPHLYVCWLLAL